VLFGVSCTSARRCTAVGEHVNGAHAVVVLAETWNGAGWSIQTVAQAGASR
jgi:hypothetical protein